MPTTQYLAFGVGAGANVLTPTAYAASPLLPIGHQPGVALSEVANTTWRQTSVASAALAQMAVDAGVDMLDDGSVANFKAGVLEAIRQLVAAQNFWRSGDIIGTVNSGARGTGWLLCNGQVVSRTTYAALFAVIGTTYGAGDGSTTFGVPDLRGEFLRGLDLGRGVDSGRVLGTAQAQQVLAHKHVAAWGESGAVGAPPFGRTDTAGKRGAQDSDTDNFFYHTNDGTNYDGTVNAAGVVGAENRPRNLPVIYYIKT